MTLRQAQGPDAAGPGPDRGVEGPGGAGPGPDRGVEGPGGAGPGPDRGIKGPDRGAQRPAGAGPGPDRGVEGPDRSAQQRGSGEIPRELAEARSSIDNLDAALLHLLAERFKITRRVGELKAAKGLPPADPEREEAQIAHLRSLAADSGLDPEFAEKFLTFIVREVVRHHEQIASRSS